MASWCTCVIHASCKQRKFNICFPEEILGLIHHKNSKYIVFPSIESKSQVHMALFYIDLCKLLTDAYPLLQLLTSSYSCLQLLAAIYNCLYLLLTASYSCLQLTATSYSYIVNSSYSAGLSTCIFQFCCFCNPKLLRSHLGD